MTPADPSTPKVAPDPPEVQAPPLVAEQHHGGRDQQSGALEQT